MGTTKVTPAHAAGFGEVQLDENLMAPLGDRTVFARAMSARRADLKVVDLERAITGLKLADTIRGSSTIDLRLHDEEWELVDSGVFDADADGRLDKIDVNYPDGSDLWWRLHQVQIDTARSGGCQIVCTFIERPAAYLMSHRGPVKASRAKKTRAQFLASLAARVKAGGGITFVCKELDVRQSIAEDKTPERAKRDKDPGIARGESLTVKGKEANQGQINVANTMLKEAEDLKASPKAVLALIMAGIVESLLHSQLAHNDLDSWGVLQIRVGLHGKKVADSVRLSTRAFLTKGFTGRGGAIELARENPGWTAGQVAQAVQGSAYPDRYDDVRPEAKAFIEAYGGDQFTNDTYTQQYNFEIGTREKPREDYWAGMNRLADEVNWPFFLDGRWLYFDAETTLIRQQPVAVIRRGDPAVIRFHCNWDQRRIATEAELEVFCNPFDIRAGQVVKLRDFGPAASGSTVGLPGRWLIEEIDRDMFSASSTLRLKQPEKELPEPRSAEVFRDQSDDVEKAGNLGEMTAKQLIDTYVVPLAEKNEMATGATPQMVEQANARHGPTVSGNASDHQGPPSVRWAADMSNGSSPTPEMDQLAEDIAETFGIPWTGSGAVTHTDAWFRYQLIYRSNVGGNHFNHVHIGVQAMGPFSPKPR